MSDIPTASLDALRKRRTTTVVVEVDGEPHKFTIAKVKVGDRKRLQAECIDPETGLLDWEAAARYSCMACVVEPELSEEDVEQIDLDVFLKLAEHISRHSNLANLAQAATPDPEEGSDAVTGFPAG